MSPTSDWYLADTDDSDRVRAESIQSPLVASIRRQPCPGGVIDEVHKGACGAHDEPTSDAQPSLAPVTVRTPTDPADAQDGRTLHHRQPNETCIEADQRAETAEAEADAANESRVNLANRNIELEAEVITLRAKVARVEALRDSLIWKRPGKSPCATPEACCGSEASCDAMQPSVRVIGADRLDAALADPEPAQVQQADEVQHCGRGVCAAMEGHEGTCAEASGWADEHEKPVVNLLAALAASIDKAKAARKTTPTETKD